MPQKTVALFAVLAAAAAALVLFPASGCGTSPTTATADAGPAASDAATPTPGDDAGSECAQPCSSPSQCPAASGCLTSLCTERCCASSPAAAGSPCAEGGGTRCDGKGHCVACLDASDCPAATGPCRAATCVDGACGTSNAASGTACASGAGKLCDGAGNCVACLAPTDCVPPATACLLATCSGDNACGTSNAASGIACSDNGGSRCDGDGTCVACLAPADCPQPTSVCQLAVCDTVAHACTLGSAPTGTACSEGGGVVCDGTGSCVASHCADGVRDADETDLDCGGSCGATCKDTDPQQICRGVGDCLSRVCSGGLCQPPRCDDRTQNGGETDVDCGGAVCAAQGRLCATGLGCMASGDCQSGYCSPGHTCAWLPTGSPCTNASQCTSMHCVDGLCCDSACVGPCMACSAALKGQGMDGTCGTVRAGGPAPRNQCPVGASPCGNTGACDGAGACAQAPSSTACGFSCSNAARSSDQCDGAGTCASGVPVACPGHLRCASASTCGTGCGTSSAAGDSNCVLGYWCDGVGLGTCEASLSSGAGCTRPAQCASGNCVGGACG